MECHRGVQKASTKSTREKETGDRERYREYFGLGGYPAGAQRWLFFPSRCFSGQQTIAPSSYTWDLECKYLNTAKVWFSLILSFKYALFIWGPSDGYSMECWVNICSWILMMNCFEHKPFKKIFKCMVEMFYTFSIMVSFLITFVNNNMLVMFCKLLQ